MDNKALGKQRLDYIDCAKGFGMVCVILGHMGLVKLNPFFSSFHMPIFFLISGYFLSEKKVDKKDFAIKKAKRLLVPYVLSGVFLIGFSAFWELVFNRGKRAALRMALLNIYGIAYGSGIYHYEPFFVQQIGPLWFLPTMFLALLIVKYSLEYRHTAIIIALSFYIGWKTSPFVWLPFDIQAGMGAALFVYIGFCARKHKVLEMRFSRPAIAGMLALWIFCVIFGGNLHMVINRYANGLLDILGAIAASLLIVLACKAVQKKSPLLVSPLCLLGKYSFIALCVHGIEHMTFPWDWFKGVVNTYTANRLFLILLTFFFKIVMVCVGVFIVKHIPILSRWFGLEENHAKGK